MGKIIFVCEYGVTHDTANCRCPNQHLTTRRVKCNVPEHAIWLDENHYPKTLRKRFEETLGDYYGGTFKEQMLDRLEQDVKDWLLDNANNIKINR